MPAPFKFGKKSLERLSEVHEDLQKVFHEVIKEFDCTVLCGYRGEAEQNEAYATGKSKLKFPKSRHNKKPAEAVDVAPYPVDWRKISEFKLLAAHVQTAANKVGVEIEWGGDWVTFRDYPHFQLKR